MMLKILDKYLLRQFVLSFLFALFAFICIFILIDLIENLGGFLDRGASFFKVMLYYYYFTPEIISLMVPVALLLASLFTVGKLTNLYEITAMKVGTISTIRILMPFLLFALLVTGVMVYFNGWILPSATKKKIQFEATQLGKYQGGGQNSNIIRQDSKNRMISIGWYDGVTQRGFNISIYDYLGTTMVQRWDAKMISWDDVKKRWELTDGMHRTFGKVEKAIAFDKENSIDFKFKPRDLLNDVKNLNLMNFTQLNDYIDAQRSAGFTDLDRYEVTYYAKVSFPFACLVVVLFGVPLSTRKKRGGLAVEFGVALMITFVYLAVQEVSKTMGFSGSWDPLFAAWFANVVFFTGGLYMLRIADK